MLACFAALVVVGCGFTPIYDDRQVVLPDTLIASIQAPTHFSGRQLVGALKQSLTPQAGGLLRLQIELSESQNGQMIDSSGKAGRYTIEHRARVRILDRENVTLADLAYKYADSFARDDNEAVNLGTEERIRSLAMRRFSQQILRDLQATAHKAMADAAPANASSEAP
jgi:outer membrane lipopolysaccharide assembly protein LptE/RlpB